MVEVRFKPIPKRGERFSHAKRIGKGTLGRGKSIRSDLRQRTWHWEELNGEDSVPREWKEEKRRKERPRGSQIS